MSAARSLPAILVPKRMAQLDASLRLACEVRRERAYTHVVDLWAWAADEHPDGDLSGVPAGVVARASDWRGNAEAWVAALRVAGFIGEDGILTRWAELQAATVAAAAGEDLPSTTAAKTEAERVRKWTQRHPGIPCPPRGAPRKASGAAAPVPGPMVSGVPPVLGQSQPGPASVPAVSQPSPANVPDIEKELHLQTEGERAEKQEHVASARDNLIPLPGIVPSPPQEQTLPGAITASVGQAARRRPDAKEPDSIEAAVTQVLERFRITSGSPGLSIDDSDAAGRERRAKIRRWLKSRIPLEKLLAACDGMVRDDNIMGRRPDNPDGYRRVETVFRDALQIDRLAALASAPASSTTRNGRQQSAATAISYFPADYDEAAERAKWEAEQAALKGIHA